MTVIGSLVLLMAGCQELDAPQYNIPQIDTGTAEYVDGEWWLYGTTSHMGYGTIHFLLADNEAMENAWDLFAMDNGNQYYTVCEADLQPGTTYYYVFCITLNETSELRGEVRSFTTPETLQFGRLTLTDWNGETIDLPATYSPFGLNLFSGEELAYDNVGIECNDTAWYLPFNVLPGTITSATAYAPHGKLTSPTTLNIATYDFIGIQDYLYGEASLDNSGNILDIHFRHAMARVIFHISLAEDNPDDQMIFNALYVGGGDSEILPTMGDLRIDLGTFENTGATGEPIRYEHPFEVTRNAPQTITLYSLPTNGGGILPISLLTDTDTSISANLEGEWSQGGTYEYEIVIDRSILGIPEVTVIPWQNNEGGDIDISH